MSEKDRKIISWRLERLSDRERTVINQWADKQDNIQQSLTNIIQHAIKRFGVDTDIMEFEVQQLLHAENLGVTVSAPKVVVQPVAVAPPVVEMQPTHPVEQTIEPVPVAAPPVEQAPVVEKVINTATQPPIEENTQQTIKDDTAFELPTATPKEQSSEANKDSEKNAFYGSAGELFEEKK